MQRDFINNISHEFRTPLTSVSLSVDVISEPDILDDKDRFHKYASILSQQTRMLQNKADTILQQAEIEHKSFNLRLEKLDLTEIINEVIDEFKISAHLRESTIDFRPGREQMYIIADRLHLNGILINLIDNALKYNDKTPRISITTEVQQKIIILVVSDNGTGIDKRNIRKVFLPFYRIPSGNIHNIKGTGLGLSYVKRICGMHHWKIGIESEYGKGTEFRISIKKHKYNG